MNSNLEYVSNRLSLRKPQTQALEIIADMCSDLTLTKNADLEMEQAKLKVKYQSFKEFEREFPCVCLALATGVGKTRLMGACVAWLFKEKGIRNFLVLAPNLTIYNKLIDDFSVTSSPKYVFPGIADFASNRPSVVTGENYNQALNQGQLFDNSAKINVFNISKINAETKGGKAPRIKRLSEYIGQSYFEHLAALDDLVLLMDESHHYRAERGMQVINELNPVLGIELTATPYTESNKGPQPFKNIVYQYSLANAIKDGYVKEPHVATRKNFDPNQYGADELDRIKLEDGIKLHRQAKVLLEEYARNEEKKIIKPFLMVVTKDTQHAEVVQAFLSSSDFQNGYYSDKTLVIHSNQRGSEKEENVQQLLSLEHDLNKIEIVIHVNMLKEGWDVTNLYTIVPLRTATSMTLREQTIGRGLRLPYGAKTGSKEVDTLTIVAHDKFQQIVDEANKPDSIIKRENIVEIDPDELSEPKEIIVSMSKYQTQLKEQAEKLNSSGRDQAATVKAQELLVKQNIVSVIENDPVFAVMPAITNLQHLSLMTSKVMQKIETEGDTISSLLPEQLVAECVQQQYSQLYQEVTDNSITIPRVVIQPSEDDSFGYRDFDLDLKPFKFTMSSTEIMKKSLTTGEVSIYDCEDQQDSSAINIPHLIINYLINHSDIDYDSQSTLIQKLVDQAINHLIAQHGDEIGRKILITRAKEIAENIYEQMKPHFYVNPKKFQQAQVNPSKRIEPHNLVCLGRDELHDYRESISPISDIPKKLFTGFKKACHTFYKFDGKSEKDFAQILEDDPSPFVCKWLRPAPSQFRIFWNNNSSRYEPDFVVETHSAIFMVEIKKDSELHSPEVRDKARAGLEYCKHVTKYNLEHAEKPWKYLLIPHGAVSLNMSFDYFANKFEETI